MFAEYLSLKPAYANILRRFHNDLSSCQKVSRHLLEQKHSELLIFKLFPVVFSTSLRLKLDRRYEI